MDKLLKNPKGYDDYVGIDNPDYSAPVMVLSTEDVEVDGLILKKNVFKEFSSKDAISHFRVNDFALENLTAIGAIDGLVASQFNDIDIDAFSAGLDSLTDSMDN